MATGLHLGMVVWFKFWLLSYSYNCNFSATFTVTFSVIIWGASSNCVCSMDTCI